MSNGLRIMPLAGTFLAMTWVAFFVGFMLLPSNSFNIFALGLPEACMVIAGFLVPLLVIRSFFFSGQVAPAESLEVSELKAKLDDSQIEALMAQISELKSDAKPGLSIEGHLEALKAGFGSGKDDLKEAGAELAKTYEGFNNGLQEQYDKIKELSAKVEEATSSVSKTLDKQTQMLDSNQSKTKELTGDLDSMMERTEAAATRVVSGLAEPINLVERRVQDSVGSMQQTVRNLDTMLDEVAEGFDAARMLAAETRQNVAMSNQELSAVVQSTHAELKVLQNSLPGQIDIIERMGAMAATKAADLDSSVTHHLSAVIDMGNDLDQRAQQMQQAFQVQAGQLAELGGMLDDLNQHAGKEIAGTLRGMVHEAHQATQKLVNDTAHASKRLEESGQSASGMMRAVFNQQSDLTGQMMHELSARLERMAGRVQGALAGVESDSVLVEEKLSGMAERVAEMVHGAGHEIIGEIEGRLSTVRDHSDHLAASLSLSAAQVSTDVEERLKEFDTRKVDLDNRLKTMSVEASGMIESQLGDVVGMVLERISRLRDEMNALGQTFSAIERENEMAMDQAAEAWFNRVTGTTKKVLVSAEQSLHSFETEVNNSLDRIRHTVEQGTEQAVLQSESLADRAASRVSGKIVSLFDTMEERARASEAGVARAEAGLQENMAKTVESLRQMVTSMASDMTETSETAVSRLIQIGREVPELAERMANSAGEAMSALNQTGETYEHQRQQIRSMVRELEEMSGRIEKRVASLDGQVERIGSGLEHESHAMHGHLAQLNKLLQQFRDTGGALTEVITERVAGLAEATDLTSNVVDSVEQRLSSLATAATDNLQRATEAATHMTQGAEEDLLKLDTLGRETYERFNETRQNMGVSLQSVEAQVAGLHETLESMAAVADQQSAKLASQSEEAQGRAQKLIDNLNEGQKTAFLRTASDIVSKLQDAAIDVDRILQGNLPTDVIRSIKEGDRSVSVRRLLGFKADGYSDSMLADMYAQDSEFRDRMNEYMQGCERLLKLALDSDPSRLMHTTVLTADVGKLYLYLRDALGQQVRAA